MKRKSVVLSCLAASMALSGVGYVMAQTPERSEPQSEKYGVEQTVGRETRTPSAQKLAKKLTDQMQDELDLRPKQYKKVFALNVKYAKKAMEVFDNGEAPFDRQNPDDSAQHRRMAPPQGGRPGGPGEMGGMPPRGGMQGGGRMGGSPGFQGKRGEGMGPEGVRGDRAGKPGMRKGTLGITSMMNLLSEKDQQVRAQKLKKILTEQQFNRWQRLESQRQQEALRLQERQRVKKQLTPSSTVQP